MRACNQVLDAWIGRVYCVFFFLIPTWNAKEINKWNGMRMNGSMDTRESERESVLVLVANVLSI